MRLGVSNGRKVVMNEQADQDEMWWRHTFATFAAFFNKEKGKCNGGQEQRAAARQCKWQKPPETEFSNCRSLFFYFILVYINNKMVLLPAAWAPPVTGPAGRWPHAWRVDPMQRCDALCPGLLRLGTQRNRSGWIVIDVTQHWWRSPAVSATMRSPGLRRRVQTCSAELKKKYCSN